MVCSWAELLQPIGRVDLEEHEFGIVTSPDAHRKAIERGLLSDSCYCIGHFLSFGFTSP